MFGWSAPAPLSRRDVCAGPGSWYARWTPTRPSRRARARVLVHEAREVWIKWLARARLVALSGWGSFETMTRFPPPPLPM